MFLHTYRNRPRMDGFFPSIVGEQQSGLYLSTFLAEGFTIEAITLNLMNKYGQDIGNGLFSKFGRGRDAFSQSDIAFIRVAFGSNQNE